MPKDVRITGISRDVRQFKGIPKPMPHIYPPPPDESWRELGAVAPVHVDTSGHRTAHTIRAVNRLKEKNMVAIKESDRLLQIAKEHGFELIRDDARGRLLKHGTSRFPLPLEGDANQWVSDAIMQICTEMDTKEEKRKPRKLPLAVNYKGETWAVYTANAGQYNLQSLEDGHRIWVDKAETEEAVTSESIVPSPSNGNHSPYPNLPIPDPEAVKRMADRDLPPLQHEPEPAAPTLTVHQAQDFSEMSPLAYSRNEMQKQITRTQLLIEMEEAKIKPLYDQLAAFQAAYSALSGGLAAATTPSAPRRTVLPPTGPGRGGGRQAGVPKTRLTYEVRKQIRDYLEDGLDPNAIVARIPGIKPYHVYTQKKAMAEGGELNRS